MPRMMAACVLAVASLLPARPVEPRVVAVDDARSARLGEFKRPFPTLDLAVSASRIKSPSLSSRGVDARPRFWIPPLAPLPGRELGAAPRGPLGGFDSRCIMLCYERDMAL